MILTAKYQIKNNEIFIHNFKISKQLYNSGLFIFRQRYFKNENCWKLNYYELCSILKKLSDQKTNLNYHSMCTVQTAQQTLKQLAEVIKSYKNAFFDWTKNPSKYSGKPNIPKYKDKYFNFTITNQNAKIKDGWLIIPSLNFKLKLGIDIKKLKEVEFKYINSKKVEVLIKHEILSAQKLGDSCNYLGIDLGINNLAACFNSMDNNCFIINGKPVKSMNQYFNRRQAELTSKLSKKQFSSNRLKNLSLKRANKLNDYFHKASKYIINYALSYGIDTIIVGLNRNFKNSMDDKANSKTRQNFKSIPFKSFLSKIRYKAELSGLNFIEVEESYTSGTSCLDNEPPTKEFYNPGRRVKRGLFVSNDGIEVNADINAAAQIIKKVAEEYSVEGLMLSPMVVSF